VSDTAERTREAVDLDRVIIRFAGDSGDGMQLTGDRFTSVSALVGNDLATLPEFPAEIRAPAGTLAGVSAFQIHISDHEITTPGDAPNVLVAMNPAALKSELHLLEPGGTVIDVRATGCTRYASSEPSSSGLASYPTFVRLRSSNASELTRIVEPGGSSARLALRAAGFIATSTLGASPGVTMSWSEMCTWNDDTPAMVPAGARISAG